jgi:hypothetical protein
MRVLTAEERQRLGGELAEMVARWSRLLGEAPGSERPPAGGTTVDEAARRREHLSRITVGEQVRVLAAELMARSADDAARYGAGYPELGEAVGVSRQAARKRWPSLPVAAGGRRWARSWKDSPDLPGPMSGAVDAGLTGVMNYGQGG